MSHLWAIHVTQKDQPIFFVKLVIRNLISWTRYKPFRDKSCTCTQTLPDGNYLYPHSIAVVYISNTAQYGKAGEFEETENKFVEKFSHRARNRHM